MRQTVLLRFIGTAAPVELSGCPELRGYIRSILPHWPAEESRAREGCVPPFLTIDKADGKYRLSSVFMEREKSYRDPVDAICSLVVELAWASLRSNPDWLCVHGAAVEFKGRLVLFPSARKAGKSTLTACLAAAGNQIFTDDFLPIDIAAGGTAQGISCGVAPRLRLPLPEDFTPRALRFLTENMTVSGRRYGYLGAEKISLARHGDRLPFGAIVLLERSEDSPTGLCEAGLAEVLKRIILQNFSRAQDAARILRVLHYIASSVPLFRLSYASAEQAAELLNREFRGWPDPVPAPQTFREEPQRRDPLNSEVRPVEVDLNGRLVRCATAGELSVEDRRFIVDSRGYAIHQLDAISGAVWTSLEQPVSGAEIADMFRQAFPEQPAAQLQRDINNVLSKFAERGLIRQAS